MTRKPGFLKLEDFKKIIDKLVDNGFVTRMSITGNGEPLLNKDIFEMIKYAKQKGFREVYLISNSTLLDNEKARKLISSGLYGFRTNFDSIDKETYEAIRKKSDYEKTKSNLINFIQLNEQAGHPIRVEVGLVKTKVANKTAQETKAFWESLPIDHFAESSLLSLGTDSDMYTEAMEYVAGKKKGRCMNPFYEFIVSWDGTARICAVDFNNTWQVGNIYTDTVDELWNGKKAQELRQALISNDTSTLQNYNNCTQCNCHYFKEYTIEGQPVQIFREIIMETINLPKLMIRGK